MRGERDAGGLWPGGAWLLHRRRARRATGASPAACGREKQGRRRRKWSRVSQGSNRPSGGFCICETHGGPSDPDLRKWTALHGRGTTCLNRPRWEAMAGRNGGLLVGCSVAGPCGCADHGHGPFLFWAKSKVVNSVH
jgi:hypothetical protein